MSKDEDSLGNVAEPSKLGVLQRLNFLAKDVVLYGFAAALSKSFALITFPLLAQHFTIEEYGVIDLFNTVVTMLVVIFTMGQDMVVSRFFYDGISEQSRKQLIT